MAPRGRRAAPRGRPARSARPARPTQPVPSTDEEKEAYKAELERKKRIVKRTADKPTDFEELKYICQQAIDVFDDHLRRADQGDYTEKDDDPEENPGAIFMMVLYEVFKAAGMTPEEIESLGQPGGGRANGRLSKEATEAGEEFMTGERPVEDAQASSGPPGGYRMVEALPELTRSKPGSTTLSEAEQDAYRLELMRKQILVEQIAITPGTKEDVLKVCSFAVRTFEEHLKRAKKGDFTEAPRESNENPTVALMMVSYMMGQAEGKSHDEIVKTTFTKGASKPSDGEAEMQSTSGPLAAAKAQKAGAASGNTRAKTALRAPDRILVSADEVTDDPRRQLLQFANLYKTILLNTNEKVNDDLKHVVKGNWINFMEFFS